MFRRLRPFLGVVLVVALCSFMYFGGLPRSVSSDAHTGPVSLDNVTVELEPISPPLPPPDVVDPPTHLHVPDEEEQVEPPNVTVPTSDFPPPVHDNITIAIVTTVLTVPPALSMWIDYHLRIVDQILLFMDDPSRRHQFEAVIRGRPVILFPGSQTANELSTESRLIYRQDANNNGAIQYGLEHNIDWLLHIDVDELFYEDGDHEWASWTDVGSILFRNHEAVPLRHGVANPFVECTLFKISDRGLSFMAYGNGKSAVRLTPGVESNGPHTFRGHQGEHRTINKPVVLHYPTPSFDSWVAKYTLYGNFSNYWYDSPDHPNGLLFMLHSRDLVLEAIATGDWGPAREFFFTQIPDEETTRRLLDDGSLERIMPLGTGS
jgi:hypothetical protein